MENPWKKFVPQSPTRQGSAEYFSGLVYISELIQSPEPMSLQVYRVMFTPGARTAWHTHPKGQILHVESGIGWFQRRGEGVLEIKAGDTIYIPPGEEHWHGASATHAMVHLALQASENGVAAHWLEHVSEEDYRL
ncbi:MAG TPA: cupin domain-containing protein [Meiothermus sp.]|jgi:quercetin dioxygenase-like cupin family protein|nr:cupin domain-containing protein [Meiothermus sp.]